LYGRGGVGKSSWIHNECKKNDLTYYDVMNPRKGSVWFDGYTNQEVLVMDDFYGWLEPSTLYRLLDIYPMQVPVKGGFTWAQWNYVFISSNVRPEEFYRKEVMDRLDQLAYERRFHRIGEMQKLYDEEENDYFIDIKWQKYEDGVVPVEKPPILDRVRQTFSNPSITEPRTFFKDSDFAIYREQKQKRLEALRPKSVEQLADDFRVSVSLQSSDGTDIQSEDQEPVTQKPGTRIIHEEMSEEIDPEDEDLQHHSPLTGYNWREAEGRFSSVDSDNEEADCANLESKNLEDSSDDVPCTQADDNDEVEFGNTEDHSFECDEVEENNESKELDEESDD